MSEVEERLAHLGLALPPVATPVASYVPAVRHGGLVFTAGQLPLVDGELPATGKVGAEVSPEDAAAYAQTCALNAVAAVHAHAPDLDRVRILKVVGYVASSTDFTGQPAVLNGASDLLSAMFHRNGVHARSAVGVAALPLDAPVEVELLAAIEE